MTAKRWNPPIEDDVESGDRDIIVSTWVCTQRPSSAETARFRTGLMFFVHFCRKPQ